MRILLAGHQGQMNRLLHQEALKRGWEVFAGFQHAPAQYYISLIQEYKIDCIVDFSNESFWPTLDTILTESPIALVSGTTGVVDQDLYFERWSTLLPLCYASNFSVGIQWIYNFLQHSPKIEYNAFLIEELHHFLKKDRPSGTALELASRLGIAPESIRVRREGEELGTHKLTLSFDDQEIVVQHRVLDRKVFAKGALLCVQKIITLAPGIYDFKEII